MLDAVWKSKELTRCSTYSRCGDSRSDLRVRTKLLTRAYREVITDRSEGRSLERRELSTKSV
jgi:hypothetical protein